MSNVNDIALFYQLQNQLNTLNKDKEKLIEEKISNLYAAGLDASFISSGWGEHNKQIVNTYGKINRYGTRFCMDNYVKTGYTFITRPRLNFSPVNLRTDRIMNLLNTPDPLDINFAIRAWLDTKFSQDLDPERVSQCPFVDIRCPFMTVLTNNLIEFSGGPSYQLEIFTDEPGFHGESQSVVMGSNSYRKPFDLQLTFADPIGGPVEAIIKFWTRYMELVAKGVMIMYPEQEAMRILNYTVSIYRFLMDPSLRYIKKWFKYTGCFPINRQGASVADFNNKDKFVEGLRKFSVGFRCASGVVDEDDPIVIREFNMLVEKYFPDIKVLRPGNVIQAEAKNTLPNKEESWTDKVSAFADPLTQLNFTIAGTVKDWLFDEEETVKLASNNVENISLVEDNLIDSTLKQAGLIRNPLLPEFNYSGIPYILDTKDGLRLEMISKNILPFDSEGNTNSVDLTVSQTYTSIMGNTYETDHMKHMFVGWDEYGTPRSIWPAMTAYATDITKEIKKVEEDTNKTISDFVKHQIGVESTANLDEILYV